MRYAIARGQAGEYPTDTYLSTYNIYLPKGSDNLQWTADLANEAISYATAEDATQAAQEAFGLEMWHVVGIGQDFEPVALCSYCDALPIMLDANGEGGPYCNSCLEDFYGAECAADWAAHCAETPEA